MTSGGSETSGTQTDLEDADKFLTSITWCQINVSKVRGHFKRMKRNLLIKSKEEGDNGFLIILVYQTNWVKLAAGQDLTS